MIQAKQRKGNTVKTEQKNYAEEYCDSIAEELRHMETLLSSEPDEPNYRSALQQLEFEHVEQGDELVTWLNENCLEITKAINNDNWEQLGYTILRTFGGPRCEIRRDINDGEWFHVDTWDGSDYHSKRVVLPALAFNLDEMLTVG